MSVDGQKQTIGKSSLSKLIALIAIFCLAVYLWLFWFQTAMLIVTRFSFRKSPLANMTPVELTDQSITAGDGPKLSCFGYDFEVPWQDVDTSHVRRETMVLIPFRSGLEILVGHGSSHSLVDTAVESTKTDLQHFRAVYGDQAAQSDYEFLRLVLNTTPASIRLLDSKQDVGRKVTLLTFKAIIPSDDSGIFALQANGFKGFQYGDPRKHPKRVTVTLSSRDGEIEFSFAQKNLKPLAVSQADINRIIQTLRYNGLPVTAQK